jgi:hypothetical protein
MRLYIVYALALFAMASPRLSHAQAAVPAPVPVAVAAPPPATPDGCYPGKENGEDVLFCPKPANNTLTLGGGVGNGGANGTPMQGPQMTTEWYGWQTLVADGASLALFVGGVSSTSSRSSSTAGLLLLGSLATYSLGGPIVHLAHSRPGAALGSFGLRWGMPSVAALFGVGLGYASCGRSSEGLCVGLYGLLGLTLGTIGAIAIDSAVLAREQVPVKFTAAKSFTWRPDLNVSPSGVSAGLSGAF